MASSYLRMLCAYSWTFSLRDSLSSAARRSSSWTAWFSWRVGFKLTNTQKSLDVTGITKLALLPDPYLAICHLTILQVTERWERYGNKAVIKLVQDLYTCVMVLRSSLSCEFLWENIWFSLLIASNSPLAPSSCCWRLVTSRP